MVYRFIVKYKTGCSFVIWKTICGAPVTETDVKALIYDKKTRQKNLKNKEGKSFKAALAYNRGSKKIEFVFDKKRKMREIFF